MIVLLMHIIDGKSKRVKIDVKSKCLSMLIHMADKSLEAFGRYPVGHMLSATSGGITVSIGANGIVNNFGAMLSRCGDPAYALWNTLTDHQVLGLHERGGMGPEFEFVCFVGCVYRMGWIGNRVGGDAPPFSDDLLTVRRFWT